MDGLRAWGSSWLKWVPTSDNLLEKAEKMMLEAFRTPFKNYFVIIKNDYKIRTIETESKSDALPLVLVHGFGSGVGLWALNLDALAKKRKVYALDLLGFGRSSRPDFPMDGAEAEELYVDSIEKWRENVGLEKFILLGHSFGGYLCASYAISHPTRVRHLIMADPWGMPEKSMDPEEQFQLPVWAKGVAAVLSLFNPLASIRGAGPMGPSLLRKARPDLNRKFSVLFGNEDTRVTDYIYHINAQTASGEVAFQSLTIPYGYAKYPMIHRVKDIDENIPISILFGSRSWMDIESGHKVKYLRSNSYVHVKIIRGAGHHVYADKPLEFNDEVNIICDKVDMSSDCGKDAEDENVVKNSDDDKLSSFLKPL